jgi:hypothetical protein
MLVPNENYRIQDCHRATVFPNSSFSEEIPENYSVNKQLMMAMGPTAYYKLANFVKNAQEDGDPLSRNASMPVQFVFSTDHTKYGTVRRVFVCALIEVTNSNHFAVFHILTFYCLFIAVVQRC